MVLILANFRIENKVNKALKFYNLDLPEVIDLRQRILTEPVCVSLIKSSMFETTWMHELKEKHPNAQFLFVIEGVLMYF